MARSTAKKVKTHETPKNSLEIVRTYPLFRCGIHSPVRVDQPSAEERRRRNANCEARNAELRFAQARRYPSGPLAGAQEDGNAFSVALGGGVDVHIFRNFWFRPAQADYVRVFRPYDVMYPRSTPENNLQLAFGFTFRFGSQKRTGGH